MSWDVKYLPEALEDLRKQDGSQKILIRKAIQKVCKNPLPENEGGYGKLLGNKNSTNPVSYTHLDVYKRQRDQWYRYYNAVWIFQI